MSKSNPKGNTSLFKCGFFLNLFTVVIGVAIASPPIPPGNIEAEAPWFGKMMIRWSDDTLDEEGYYFQYRSVPQSEWITLSTLDSPIRELQLNGGSPTQEYEFRILSFNDEEVAASQLAKVTMPDRFLNSTFANLKYGTPFVFEMNANNISNSENITYEASLLPNGLSVDQNSGIISGSAEEDGFFDVLLKATYESPESVPSIAKLALRIPPQPSAPELINSIPSQEIFLSEDNLTLNLGDFFIDPDTRKAIRIKTNKGEMVFSLFDKATPIPVDNFLDYVRAETYKDNIFHRSVTANSLKIIQSGSFFISENKLSSNITSNPIINEPGIANERGTIAYARTSNPDSATSGWYINGGDSSGLDVGDSYTVFGRATKESLPIIDSIQEMSTGTFNLNINGQTTSVDDFPTNDGLEPNLSTKENIAIVENIEIIKPLDYEIISVTDSNIARLSITSDEDNSELIINPLEVGTTKVKIQSTDIDGNRIDILFDVSVFNSFTEWALINNIEDNPDKYLLRYAFGKSLEISKKTPHRSPKIDIIDSPQGPKPAISFYQRNFSKDLKYTIQCSDNLNDWENIWNSENEEDSEIAVNSINVGEFSLFTITKTEFTEVNQNLFFRVLVQYLENN